MKSYDKFAVLGSTTVQGVSYSVRSYCKEDQSLCGGSWKPRADGKYVDPKGNGTNLFTILHITDSKRDAEKIRDHYYAIADIAGITKVKVAA